MIPFELVSIFAKLQQPASRAAGAQALAQYAGARRVLLFGGASGRHQFMPAPGLPAACCEGPRWQDFLHHCVSAGSASGSVPDPADGPDLRAFGLSDDAAHAIVVFVEAQPDQHQCRALAALLPFLGTALASEPAALAAKDAERRGRDADRRKDEFLAMLAHELRNPLAPISMAAQLLKRGSTNPARLQQTCQIIDRQVTHMTCLLDDLLDVSRVAGGKAQLACELHDMRRIVDQALEQARALINARGHHVTLNLAERGVTVWGDPTRLVQVATNLLNNASKYTPPGGDIWVRLAVRASEVVLTVRDSGVGIERALLPHVFDLFIQGERASDRAHGGLGLGLAMVQSLVQRHGGAVAVRSEGTGRGSEFEVALPSAGAPGDNPGATGATSASSATSATSATGVACHSGAALDILIVDDNEDAARTLALFLQAHGHNTRVAFDGQQALAMAAVLAPHVLLLDIGLPGMDGWELARRLRTLPGTRDSLCIALSGYGMASDRECSRRAGFDHHLTKPVDAMALVRMLATVKTVAAG